MNLSLFLSLLIKSSLSSFNFEPFSDTVYKTRTFFLSSLILLHNITKTVYTLALVPISPSFTPMPGAVPVLKTFMFTCVAYTGALFVLTFVKSFASFILMTLPSPLYTGATPTEAILRV